MDGVEGIGVNIWNWEGVWNCLVSIIMSLNLLYYTVLPIGDTPMYFVSASGAGGGDYCYIQV